MLTARIALSSGTTNRFFIVLPPFVGGFNWRDRGSGPTKTVSSYILIGLCTLHTLTARPNFHRLPRRSQARRRHKASPMRPNVHSVSSSCEDCLTCPEEVRPEP